MEYRFNYAKRPKRRVGSGGVVCGWGRGVASLTLCVSREKGVRGAGDTLDTLTTTGGGLEGGGHTGQRTNRIDRWRVDGTGLVKHTLCHTKLSSSGFFVSLADCNFRSKGAFCLTSSQQVCGNVCD